MEHALSIIKLILQSVLGKYPFSPYLWPIAATYPQHYGNSKHSLKTIKDDGQYHIHSLKTTPSLPSLGRIIHTLWPIWRQCPIRCLKTNSSFPSLGKTIHTINPLMNAPSFKRLPPIKAPK